MKPYLFWSLLFCLTLLSSCQVAKEYKTHDTHMNLGRQQIYEGFAPTSPVPPVIPPSLPKAKEPQAVFPKEGQRKISLSLSDTTPLKSVFHQIAQQSHLTISLDPRLSGGVTYHAHEKSVQSIIEDLCEASGSRYRIKRDTIHIEPDTPYHATYEIQYLTLNRKNQSRVSIATDVFTSEQKEGGQGANGSNATVTSEALNDFWPELEANIQGLLSPYGENSKVTFHRQGGLLSACTNQKGHEALKSYLTVLEQTMTSQVLIEAKIIEVQLHEAFQSGINWSTLKGDFVLQSPMGQLVKPGAHDPMALPQRDAFTIGGSGTHLTGLVSFLKTFGTVRTLSSPRLAVMNNQSAILKVATNEVYFRIQYSRDQQYSKHFERESASSEVHTVPIGLVMMVHPAINVSQQSVMMTLRPTISRIVDQKEDPAVSILSKQSQKSFVPQVQVREFDSVVTVTSGQPLILAGLMDDRGDVHASGLPDVEDVPFFGNLFKGKSNDLRKTELVIFLRAFILPRGHSGLSVTAQDQNVYETFSKDPRPLTFHGN